MHAHGTLWLEVTNGCNLNCQHCYSDSYPGSDVRDALTLKDYSSALHAAFQIGFRSVQFIGGEPTTYAHLPMLIREASHLGFDRIEVFTNLHRLPEPVLNALMSAQGHLATSVYASCAGMHDKITRVAGSFTRTMANLKKVTAAGIPVRAGFVEMNANLGQFEPTRQLLAAAGVSDIQFDRVRNFGRATQSAECMSELCGACAGDTACISYDGNVYACIMSRKWPLGSLKDSPLSDILFGPRAASVRRDISIASRNNALSCGPDCLPGTCHPHLEGCLPNTCHPNLKTHQHAAPAR